MQKVECRMKKGGVETSKIQDPEKHQISKDQGGKRKRGLEQEAAERESAE